MLSSTWKQVPVGNFYNFQKTHESKSSGSFIKCVRILVFSAFYNLGLTLEDIAQLRCPRFKKNASFNPNQVASGNFPNRDETLHGLGNIDYEVGAQTQMRPHFKKCVSSKPKQVPVRNLNNNQKTSGSKSTESFINIA